MSRTPCPCSWASWPWQPLAPPDQGPSKKGPTWLLPGTSAFGLGPVGCVFFLRKEYFIKRTSMWSELGGHPKNATCSPSCMPTYQKKPKNLRSCTPKKRNSQLCRDVVTRVATKIGNFTKQLVEAQDKVEPLAGADSCRCWTWRGSRRWRRWRWRRREERWGRCPWGPWWCRQLPDQSVCWAATIGQFWKFVYT